MNPSQLTEEQQALLTEWWRRSTKFSLLSNHTGRDADHVWLPHSIYTAMQMFRLPGFNFAHDEVLQALIARAVKAATQFDFDRVPPGVDRAAYFDAFVNAIIVRERTKWKAFTEAMNAGTKAPFGVSVDGGYYAPPEEIGSPGVHATMSDDEATEAMKEMPLDLAYWTPSYPYGYLTEPQHDEVMAPVREELDDVLSEAGITKREREALLALAEVRNFTQVGERLGISRQGATKLCKRAIAKLNRLFID